MKPYLKRLMKFSGFDVWIVDGDYIRNNIDVDFVTYGQHYKDKFIPKNEFWIERERVPGEYRFYLKPLLIEYRLMEKGISYKNALKKSNLAEKRERMKDNLLKRIFRKKKKIKKDADLVHKKLLKIYSKKIKVWIVDGELVRDLFSVDFEKGGHDKFYNFIPKNEIWIDDDVEMPEIKFILLHEIHERKLMIDGMKYSQAHKDANKIELHYRKNPKEINSRLKFEILENNKNEKSARGKDRK